VFKSRNFDALRAELSKKLTVLDGGLATSLEALGHDLSGTLWSARLLQDEPTVLADVNRSHALAGADIVSTASYQVSRQGFVAAGFTPDMADAAISQSVAITRDVANSLSRATGRTIAVAGSLGPYGAVLADGSEYRGDYTISESNLKHFHRERLNIMTAAAPDFLAFETVPSVMELRVINQLLTEEFTDIPAWVSCSAADGAHISDGTPTAIAFQELTADAVVAFGFNCVKPEYVESLLESISAVRSEVPRIVYSNAGRTWDAINRCWLDAGAELVDTATLKRWYELDARIIGGCCGLGELHLSNLREFANTLHNE